MVRRTLGNQPSLALTAVEFPQKFSPFSNVRANANPFCRSLRSSQPTSHHACPEYSLPVSALSPVLVMTRLQLQRACASYVMDLSFMLRFRTLRFRSK